MSGKFGNAGGCDFQYFDQFLAEGRRQYYPGRKLCGNTRVFRNADAICVQYHSTTILRFTRGGDIELDMGGWETVTTRERINSFSPLVVWSCKGQWYVSRNHCHYNEERKNLPIFLYGCDQILFPADRRRCPEDVHGTPLVRKSVHERHLRLAKEKMQRKTRAAAKVRCKIQQYAAYIESRGLVESAFRVWVVGHDLGIHNRLRRVAADAVRQEISALEATVAVRGSVITEQAKRIVGLQATLDARNMNTGTVVPRERVIDLAGGRARELK